MNIFSLLFLVVCHINGQAIFGPKEYAMLERDILEDVRQPVLELVKAFIQSAYMEHTKSVDLVRALTHQLSTQSNVVNRQSAEIEELRRDLSSLVQGSCPDFYLDESTLHPLIYLSEDKKTIFNTRRPLGELFSARPYDWPVGSYKKYKGTRGSLLIQPPDQVYFEVCVRYNIVKKLRAKFLIFEVGIAKDEIIDLHHYVGDNSHAWSFGALLSNYTGRVTFYCWHDNKTVYHKVLSPNEPGTSKTFMYGIHVDAQGKQMSVTDTERNVLIYTFTDIDFTQPLRPVFGVYNAKQVHVEMKLKTGLTIKHLSKCIRK